jgi:Methylase involved in ubiquinone/menaquinone biosynthesis
MRAIGTYFMLLSYFSSSFLVVAFMPSRLHGSFQISATTTIVTTISQQSSSLQASRVISTFEPDDFALPTGNWPYTEADMGRLDPTDDANFYDYPRFVTHIDDRAIESLTEYYREEFGKMYEKKGSKIDILDLCSSWISHFPKEMEDAYGLTVGIGMNEEELAKNSQLYMHYVQDLNKNPLLTQFQDNSFDIVTNVVSVDYLVKPKEIFQEIHRVLRPGGVALMSFSNRCFPSKAIAMWLQADDIGRLSIVGSYFHYSAQWETIEALDIRLARVEAPPRPSVQDILKDPSKAFAWASTAGAVAKMNAGDPMFVVKGFKKGVS